MNTLKSFVVVLGLLLGSVAHAQAPAAPPAAAAPAGENPFEAVALDRYVPNVEKGDLALEAGRRLLADLKAAKPAVWASVVEAARFDIQNEETDKFARQKSYVIYAYAALWIILLVFVVGVFARQRKLNAELAELERRVGRARE